MATPLCEERGDVSVIIKWRDIIVEISPPPFNDYYSPTL